MPFPEKIQRNEEIYGLIERGEKFSFVAEKFRISTNRVTQIYYRLYWQKNSSNQSTGLKN